MNKKIKKYLIISISLIFFSLFIFEILVFLYFTPVLEKVSCTMSNGNWKTFSNGCADKCNYSDEPTVMCTMSFVGGCDCGKNKCWTGNKCVEEIWSKKREEISEKISKCYDDNGDKCYKKENYSKY